MLHVQADEAAVKGPVGLRRRGAGRVVRAWLGSITDRRGGGGRGSRPPCAAPWGGHQGRAGWARARAESITGCWGGVVLALDCWGGGRPETGGATLFGVHQSVLLEGLVP